jgi:hypothetical protein
LAFPKRLPDGERPLEHKKIHAFIATPAYDGKVHSEYSQSLAESFRDAALLGIKTTACVMGNGAFIDLARNIYARLFLESECTHLFFIDSDLKWESQAFLSLLTAGLPVCAGAYPKRQKPEEYPIRYVLGNDGKGLEMRGDWIMCDRVATGFLCIERSVIEKMTARAPMIIDKSATKPHPPTAQLFYTYRQENGQFVGEDFAWCKDYCEQFNDYIWVYPNFTFTHKKDYTGNWHDFLIKDAERLMAEDAAKLKEQSAA